MMLRTEAGQGGLSPPSRCSGMDPSGKRGGCGNPECGSETVEIDLGPPVGDDMGMVRPPQVHESDEVYIADGEALEEVSSFFFLLSSFFFLSLGGEKKLSSCLFLGEGREKDFFDFFFFFQARKALGSLVKKNAYPGDWRIKVGLVVIVFSTFYLFCYDILFPWIEVLCHFLFFFALSLTPLSLLSHSSPSSESPATDVSSS